MSTKILKLISILSLGAALAALLLKIKKDNDLLAAFEMEEDDEE